MDEAAKELCLISLPKKEPNPGWNNCYPADETNFLRNKPPHQSYVLPSTYHDKFKVGN